MYYFMLKARTVPDFATKFSSSLEEATSFREKCQSTKGRTISSNFTSANPGIEGVIVNLTETMAENSDVQADLRATKKGIVF